MKKNNDNVSEPLSLEWENVSSRLLDNINEAVFAVDNNGKVIYMNTAAEKLTGKFFKESVNRHFLHTCRLSVDNREITTSEWNTFLESGVIPQSKLIGPEGAASFINGVLLPLSETEKIKGGSIIIIRDASDIARVEQAFLNTRASFHNIVEINKDGIVIIDKEGLVKYANPAARQFIGCPDQDLIGERLNLQLSPGEVQEIQISRENGELGSGEVRVVPTVWDEEQALLASVRDITERKKLQEQLNQSQKMEAIGRLAAGVAHDFNNLLTLIRGSGQLMQFSMAEDDPNNIELSEIMNAVDRATAMTTQLLALSRKQVLTPQVVNLNQIIVDLEKMLRRLINEDIELITDLDGKNCTIKVDVVQTEQVLLNLVINSRDAMPNGGRLIIRTRIVEKGYSFAENDLKLKHGPQAMLQVIDTGTGIGEENLKHIFEPFFTTKARGKGTGLGLSTVYGIVHQSGGAIAAKSQLGKGTTFTIYFPITDEEEDIDTAKPAEKLIQAGNETVLVAEDEGAVRRLISRILKINGYRVIESANGEEALKIIQDQDEHVDLLLSDVVMPILSGPELVRRAKQARPELKILFVSGHGLEAVHQQKLKNMDNAFLRKPFLPADLIRMVRTILDGPHQEVS